MRLVVKAMDEMIVVADLRFPREHGAVERPLGWGKGG